MSVKVIHQIQYKSTSLVAGRSCSEIILSSNLRVSCRYPACSPAGTSGLVTAASQPVIFLLPPISLPPPS